MPEFAKTFSRFTQRAGELVNINEKTNYPPQTEKLIEQIDQMKPWVNRIITATEEFVEITIATKVVDTFQKNRERTNTSDRLSDAFDRVAKESENVAPNLCKMLKEAANMHLQMATAKKSFNDEVQKTFIEDLKAFLNGPHADAIKAKTRLQECRLDMDSDKAKLKSAKDNEQKAKWEAEVRRDEAEYDKIHSEAVAIFQKTAQEFDELNVQLLDLIRAEQNYYDNCAKECALLLKQL
ncbi:hypothetical protein Aperf_G00000057253 [Anoplocephala perfoliata]